jgi:pimeloyl-ACP methyl ester carboxylesterase
MSALRGSILVVGAIGLAALAAWWTLLWVAQRRVLFPAPLAAGGAPQIDALGALRTWLEAPGLRAEAWLLPATGGGPDAAPLIVFAHGNGELIDHWAREFETARERGAAVLLVEYPGYGRSAGRPSQDSITRAFVAAYDWAVAQPRIDGQRVIGWGRSLGGGAVCALARERRLRALVLESTFTSVRAIAARFGLPGFLVRDPFDNRSVVAAFAGPILLLHGEHDEVIASAHARALHAAAGTSELQLAPCGHNDCPRPWPSVGRFLAHHGIL